MLSLDDAIRQLRRDPQYADLVHHAYLGPDVLDSAQRFLRSSEFREVMRLLDGRIGGRSILDVGAGIGVASSAFARNGAQMVYALEPDRSELVGLGAMERVIDGLPVQAVQGVVENLPLADESLDIVYGRQVFHHTSDLERAVRECARVLRKGGIFLACREHVIKDEADRDAFLQSHVVHQLAGGENAYRLGEYTGTIDRAGLQLQAIYSTFESVINYFPMTTQDIEYHRRKMIRNQWGRIGSLLNRLPGLRSLVQSFIDMSYPGNMYSFLAIK